jgi:uncharacterized protein YyaL (SSP411 family)
MVTKSMDNMAAGGVYDNEEGAFFRYSTTRDWSIPHYEKMCEDNAKLLAVYLHAYQVTGRARYREIVDEIIRYVNTTLSDQERGGFYGSQDADEEYYKLPKAKRSTMKAPYVDRTIYTDWNGLMISAYLKAAPILGNLGTKAFALNSIERLLTECYANKENAMYHYTSEGVPHLQGLLADQITFGEALLNAYQSTGDSKYVNRAEKLVHHIDETLLDLKGGGYYDSPPDVDSLGYLRQPTKPLDENSIAAMLLTKLHSITGVEAYLQRARSTLESLAGQYRSLAYVASTYAIAVDLFLNEPTQVVIVGSKSDPITEQLHDASLRAYDPRKVVIPLDPSTDAQSLSRLGYSTDVEPRAYVCFGKTCLQPVSEPEEIARQLSRVHK